MPPMLALSIVIGSKEAVSGVSDSVPSILTGPLTSRSRSALAKRVAPVSIVVFSGPVRVVRLKRVAIGVQLDRLDLALRQGCLADLGADVEHGGLCIADQRDAGVVD